MPKGIWKPLTKREETQIINEYLDKPIKKLAREIGISNGRVMRFLNKKGLIIPRELVEQRKIDSLRKKGEEPYNKGLKIHEYMSPEAIAKSSKSRFKKGHVPHNICVLGNGTIRIRKESDGRKYKYIRVKVGEWKLYHRHIWEKAHGPIPEDSMIVFKDGNGLNCKIENLQLITKIENMYRNSKVQYPKEIIPSLVLVKKIDNKIKDL